MPKYYNDYCLQDHDDESYQNIHTKMYEKKNEESRDGKNTNNEEKQKQQIEN